MDSGITLQITKSSLHGILFNMKKYIVVLWLVLGLIACSNDGDNISKGDGTGGSLAIFTLRGDFLYTVDENTLHVFNISSGANPELVHSMFVGFGIETIYTNGNFLYLGSQLGMYMYSLTTPETPTFVSEARHLTACDPVVANATHAFVTLHSNNFCGNNTNVLQVYDIQNPQQPVLVHQKNLSQPKGLGLYHNYLLVCDNNLKIFDITQPQQPQLVKTIAIQSFDVIIQGNDLFAVGPQSVYRYLLDASDIDAIELKSQIHF